MLSSVSGLENTHHSCWYESILVRSSALIRPGRFDMQVTVPKPDVKGRTEILNWYLKKIKVDPGVFTFTNQLSGSSLKLLQRFVTIETS